MTKRSRLDIRLAERCNPPTGGHKLLLGFQFGNDTEAPDHPATICLQLKPLNHPQLTEAWWYEGDVSYTQAGRVRIAECLEYTVAVIQRDATDSTEIRTQTRQSYIELINAVRSTKHKHLVRVWNYLDEINSGEGDSERYRQFSIGRAEAFQEKGISDEHSPTGTAIGTQSGGLTLIIVASNHEYCPVENPNQTSAFNYPIIYGPKSPKFSRGGLVSSESHRLFLISGTAAVVGHESNFHYNTRLQANETIKNLDCLCDAISEAKPDAAPFALDDQSILRVYVKNPEDYTLVSQILDASMNVDKRNIAFLHGTICRRELMVEIDGVKVV